MRSLLLPVALAALAASLSGCFWWGMEDFGDDERVEPEFPFALLGVLLIVGTVLVAVNLSSPPGDRQPPSPPQAPQAPPQAPTSPAPQAPPPAATGWQRVEEPAAPRAPKKAAKPPAAKARRRQP